MTPGKTVVDRVEPSYQVSEFFKSTIKDATWMQRPVVETVQYKPKLARQNLMVEKHE